VAIVGFDDTELAAALDLTTVWQPLEESGRMGFRYLREGIDAPSVTPRHVTLGVQLVVRETV
jgi:DNA-binding LacI/PurR family transcriptional regulator